MSFLITRRAILASAPMAALIAKAGLAAGFDPEKSTLTAADGHTIPLSTWRARGRRIGIISFSHGAASAPWKYPDMIGAWVGAGYDVVAPLHVDSTDHPQHDKYPGLATWKARIEDMRAVSAHIGGPHIAAGHSYGGLTALVQGGAQAVVPEGVTGSLRDATATCVVAFSPPPPIPGLITAEGYATLETPALVETGTIDIMPGGTPDSWHGHLAGYDNAAPGGHRYGLVLDGANHYFGGLICDATQPGPIQAAQLKTAIRLSLAFMAEWGTGSQVKGTLDQEVGTKDGFTLTTK
ncbi:MAG: hypothetical protein PW843_30055 [Azospirillaceae bacterium]|nr:hypothetical protein [Azospirillaceae bacterium]